MAGIPEYRSHKIVRAAKIVETGPPDIIVTVEKQDGSNARIEVPVGWAAKRGKGDDMGYLVEYDDGYMSWSPSKAFEEGYALVARRRFPHD